MGGTIRSARSDSKVPAAIILWPIRDALERGKFVNRTFWPTRRTQDYGVALVLPRH